MEHPQAEVSLDQQSTVKKALAVLEKYQGRNYLISYNVASLLKRVGQRREAERRFAELAKRGKNIRSRSRYVAGSFFHLGEISLLLNRPDRARGFFCRCLQIMPNHKKAKEYLDMGLMKRGKA